MSSRRWRSTVGLLFLLGFMMALALGCRGGEEEEEEGPVEEEVIPVRVDTIEERVETLRVNATSTIEAWEQAMLAGQQGQRITRIDADEGDRVRRGEVVAVMDDANLRQAQVELRTLEREVERLRRLVEIGAVAQQQLDQTEAQLETVQNQIQVLESNTYLRAPISGVVTGRFFVPGEQFVVSAQTPALLVIQELDRLKVPMSVPERYFGTVQPGMTARVRVDAHGDRVFEGEVWRVQPTVSPESRTFRVEIELDNEERRLSPGMFARLSLDVGERRGFFIPRSAVIRRPGQEPFVYVVDQSGERVERRDVREGDRLEDLMEIVGGLQADDAVVVEGMSRLAQGSKIRIVEER